jgi:hypothetical protein
MNDVRHLELLLLPRDLRGRHLRREQVELTDIAVTRQDIGLAHRVTYRDAAGDERILKDTAPTQPHQRVQRPRGLVYEQVEPYISQFRQYLRDLYTHGSDAASPPWAGG